MSAVLAAVHNLTEEMALELHWEDGSITFVTHFRLRSSCRCAHCHAVQVKTGRPLSGLRDVTLLQFESVGTYGLRLFFSDGHSRGIYPWVYLRELGGNEDGRGVERRSMEGMTSYRYIRTLYLTQRFRDV